MTKKQFEWTNDPIANYLSVYDWHWTENRPMYAGCLPMLRTIVYAAVKEEVRWMEKDEQNAWFSKHEEPENDKTKVITAVAKDILGIEELFDDVLLCTLNSKNTASMQVEDVINWCGLSWYLPKNKSGTEMTYEEYYSSMGLRVPNSIDVPADMLEAIGRWYPYANLCLMLFTADKLYETILARHNEITKEVQLHSGGLENIMDVIVSPERSKEEGLSLKTRKEIRELLYARSYFWDPAKCENVSMDPTTFYSLLTARRKILANS